MNGVGMNGMNEWPVHHQPQSVSIEAAGQTNLAAGFMVLTLYLFRTTYIKLHLARMHIPHYVKSPELQIRPVNLAF